jgi:hypothetical protein
MNQTESPSMKSLPIEPRASSVDRIANERKTEVLQMHSNLMSATRL